jgi:succinate-semialdehyde dehydrogenase/glutarate-semialdehyde dehydrogenase
MNAFMVLCNTRYLTKSHDESCYMPHPPYPSLSLLVGGKRVYQSDSSIDVINPANGTVLASLPLAGAAELDEAVAAAAASFPAWRDTAARDRGAILAKAATLLRERAEAIATTLVRENGKPLSEARSEVSGSADVLDWFAEEGKRSYGRTIPARTASSRMFTRRDPVGVVALFMAWNYPATNFARKVAPALAAGCTIVAKPSEETPGAPLAFAQCLIDAGLPDGVLNVVFGDPPAVSDHLIRHPLVRKISFTGSTRVGRELASLAGKYLKRTTMELGGHAPLIVCDDVDARKVATLATAFKFRNAGQICTSPTRFYVHERIADDFVAHMAEIAAQLELGDGLDAETSLGPLTHRGRKAAMAEFVNDALAHGANVRLGGDTHQGQGFFFPPTILTDVGEGAAILTEEPFGPIVPVVRFSDLDDAIAASNDTPYGLSAYAFTTNLARAQHLSANLEAGQVCINNFMPSLPETPAGGFKDSGWGYENGVEGLEPYLQTKFVHEMPL